MKRYLLAVISLLGLMVLTAASLPASAATGARSSPRAASQSPAGLDDPLFPNWDQDATAVEDRYAEQDPAQVAAELRRAAFAIAGRFENVTSAQWQRTGNRSDGARFTVETFARYLMHDPVHHLYDVTGRRAVPT